MIPAVGTRIAAGQNHTCCVRFEKNPSSPFPPPALFATSAGACGWTFPPPLLRDVAGSSTPPAAVAFEMAAARVAAFDCLRTVAFIV